MEKEQLAGCHGDDAEGALFVQESQAGRGEESLSWGLKGLEGKHLLDMVTKLGAFCYRVGQLGVLRSET